MSEIIDFISRATTRLRLNREVFSEKSVPDSLSKVRIIPFFGDIKSEFILSSLILPHLFRKDYIIVCSFSGHWGIYQDNINEFWSISDGDAADAVRNPDNNTHEKLLLRYFENVSLPSEFVPPYFSDGFTSKYFNEFKDIEYNLPSIPSARISFGADNKPKILLSPTKYIHRWGQGREEQMILDDRFWEILVKKLIGSGYSPVLLQNYGTHDLSPKFSNDCFYVTEKNLLAVLAVMRACDCVLDVFNGLSRYALIARCPYIVLDERQRYFNTYDYILDDMCGKRIPKRFLFSFAPLVTGASSMISDSLLDKIEEFLPNLDRNNLPSTIQQTTCLTYDDVRKRQSQKIGSRLIKVPDLTL